MTTFITYRDGDGELAQRIQAAITHFYQRRGKLPAAIIVPKSKVADALTALDALGLDLPVRDNGGTLATEVWLQLPKTMITQGGYDGQQE